MHSHRQKWKKHEHIFQEERLTKYILTSHPRGRKYGLSLYLVNGGLNLLWRNNEPNSSIKERMFLGCSKCIDLPGNALQYGAVLLFGRVLYSSSSEAFQELDYRN